MGDDPAAVARNRATVAAALGLPPTDAWAWMQQVHGADVVRVDAAPLTVPVADALVTTTPGLALAVVTADCAPIVLANDGAVGVVHAGHRGLVAGVIERALDAVRAAGRGDVRALLGPCIRAARYEFSERDLAPLVEAFGAQVAARTEWGTPALDLTAAVRAALTRAGVAHFEDTGICTSASRDHFSYRRDGVTGRQGAFAWLS